MREKWGLDRSHLVQPERLNIHPQGQQGGFVRYQ